MAAKTFVQIKLPSDPGAALEAGTKQYIDTADNGKANTSHTHAESDVTSLTSDLALKAPLASPTFTGTATFAKMVQAPVTLTFVSGGTTLVDASLGNTFRLTFGAGNTTMGAPSNPTDGQMIIFEIKQDGTGSRTITWNAAYVWGTDVVVPVLSTAANKTDYVGFIYNSSAAVWRGLALARGY